MRFTSERTKYGEILLEEQECFDAPLPIGFEDIQTFMEHRQAPKHRKHVQKLLREAGCEDLEGFLLISKALSLNDTYWAKPAESALLWETVSLYRNDFNEIIAQIAFTGGEGTTDFLSTSPEYGTGGAYAKCWIRSERSEPESGRILLLKGGSDTHGIEPYSDFFASQLAEIFSGNAVKYGLMEWHGKLVSYCPIFTSEQEGYVPAVRFLDSKKHNQISYLMKYFSELGLEEDFQRMVILDALIVNEDRHAGNYGMMVDNRSQKILRMAPLFDHNRSLLYGFHGKVGEEAEYLKQQIPRIGGDFNTVANSVLTPKLTAELKNLRGFSFRQDDAYLMDQERVDMLSGVVNKQIDNILGNRQMYYFG